MKSFPKLAKEDHLELDGYKFVPKEDITPYELALITDALLLTKTATNALLKSIIRRWPLPNICRHLEQKSNEDWDAETEIKKSIQRFFKRDGSPTMADVWWRESINRALIEKWLAEGEG